MQPRKEHYRRKLPHFQQPGQWYSVTCLLVGVMPIGAMTKYTNRLNTARTRYQLLQQESVQSRESNFPKSDISDLGKSESQNLQSRESEFPNSDNFNLGKLKSHLAQAKKDYQIALRNYRLAYDKILNKSELPGVSLVKDENRKVLEEALLFWEGKRLRSHAWCIMPNHFHWVLSVFEKEAGQGLSKSVISDLGKSESRESAPIVIGIPNSDKVKPVYLQDILHSVKLFTARRINKNENRTGQLWFYESFETTIRSDRHFANVLNYTLQNPVSAGLVQDWRDWAGTKVFGESATKAFRIPGR